MDKPHPIPEGYHTVTPYLIVKGADQAIEFYKKAFGAILLERHPAPDGRVMNAAMRIGNSIVMLSDEFPESSCGVGSPSTVKGSTVMLHLYVEDVDAFFAQAQEAGGKVKMPLLDAFWGDRYGQLEDPFGHIWSMATRIADQTPEEAKAKADEFLQSLKPE